MTEPDFLTDYITKSHQSLLHQKISFTIIKKFAAKEHFGTNPGHL